MPTSSSMTRMSDFTLARVDTDRANRSLLRSGSVDVDGQHVARGGGAGGAIVGVSRVNGPPVDFHQNLVPLNAGIISGAHRIDARDDDAANAAWQSEPSRRRIVDVAHVQAQRHTGVARRPDRIGFIDDPSRLPARPLGETDGHGLRAAVPHNLQPREGTRTAPSDFADDLAVVRHALVVDPGDEVVDAQSRAMAWRTARHVLH